MYPKITPAPANEAVNFQYMRNFGTQIVVEHMNNMMECVYTDMIANGQD